MLSFYLFILCFIWGCSAEGKKEKLTKCMSVPRRSYKYNFFPHNTLICPQILPIPSRLPRQLVKAWKVAGARGGYESIRQPGSVDDCLKLNAAVSRQVPRFQQDPFRAVPSERIPRASSEALWRHEASFSGVNNKLREKSGLDTIIYFFISACRLDNT
jgi:hypothetical protein